MPTAVLSPDRVDPQQDDTIPCDCDGCARRGLSDHSASHEVLLECGDVRYWCELAIRECDRSIARLARAIADVGADVDDEVIEMMDGPMLMSAILALVERAISEPTCAWCGGSAGIVAAAPLG